MLYCAGGISANRRREKRKLDDKRRIRTLGGARSGCRVRRAGYGEPETIAKDGVPLKLYLCPNGFTDEQVEQAAHCVRALSRLGHECAASIKAALNAVGCACADFAPEDSDMIVSLGGDGALLRAAQTAIASGKPLIGINGGRLGYLCALRLDEAEAFDEVLAACAPTERMLLAYDTGGGVRYALNDVVVAKINYGADIDLAVRVDGQEAFRLRGDGVIISTPTGSTAYTLSAGGPIVDLDARVLAVTMICARASVAHPIVLSDRKTIEAFAQPETAQVFADGVRVGGLAPSVTVRRSDKTLRLFVPPERAQNYRE